MPTSTASCPGYSFTCNPRRCNSSNSLISGRPGPTQLVSTSLETVRHSVGSSMTRPARGVGVSSMQPRTRHRPDGNRAMSLEGYKAIRSLRRCEIFHPERLPTRERAEARYDRRPRTSSDRFRERIRPAIGDYQRDCGRCVRGRACKPRRLFVLVL